MGITVITGQIVAIRNLDIRIITVEQVKEMPLVQAVGHGLEETLADHGAVEEVDLENKE